MGAFLSILKIPFVNRLINTVTTSKKATVTTTTLVAISMVGLINKDEMDLLSGLNPYIVIPIISLAIVLRFLPKVYSFLVKRELNRLSVDLEEKKKIVESLEYDIRIKELKRKLKNGV